MKLKIGERLGLLQILPKEGDFVTLKVVRDLQNELSFSEEEIKNFGFVQNGDKISWATDKSEEVKDCKIGDKAKETIVDTLKKLDEEKKLNAFLFPLYEKFVETEV